MPINIQFMMDRIINQDHTTTMSIFKNAELAARRLHEKAMANPVSFVKIPGHGEWVISYDASEQVFYTTGPGLEIGPKLNTRKMSVAKKWLREWLEN